MNWKFGVFLLAAFFFYYLISLPYYSGDVKNHVVWGKSIADFGTYGFFDRQFPGYSFPTYPPLIMAFFGLGYVFSQWVLGLVLFFNNFLPIFPSNLIYFFQWENTQIAFLKLPGIIATILMGYTLYLFYIFLNERKVINNKYFLPLILFLNPAVIYITAIWGQTDLLQNLFILTAFYFLFKKKILISALFAGLALVSKHTVVLYWFIYFLILLRYFGVKNFLYGAGINILIFYLAYLPFHGFSLSWPINFYVSNFSVVNFQAAENAINLWGAVSSYKDVDPRQVIFIFNYDQWGYLFFGLLFIPLTIYLMRKKMNYQKLFHYLVIVSIIYFFFLTKMHERYLIPAVIYSSILVIFSKKYWSNLIFFSLLHFLNLYRGLYQPGIILLDILVKSTFFLNILVVTYFVFIIVNLYMFFKIKTD